MRQLKPLQVSFRRAAPAFSVMPNCYITLRFGAATHFSAAARFGVASFASAAIYLTAATPAQAESKLAAPDDSPWNRAEPAEQTQVNRPGAASSRPATPAPSSPPEDPADDPKNFGHRGQFGLRAAFMGSYRMVLRKDETPLCNEPDLSKEAKDQQKFCGFMGPPALDLALSFAPLHSIEPFLWLRLGLSSEDKTKTDPVRIYGLGLRAYTLNDSPFKVFIEPAVGISTESGSPESPAFPGPSSYAPDYKTDLLFRLSGGPQYDIGKYVGIYVQAGVSVGILRSINAGLEFGGGLQLRAP